MTKLIKKNLIKIKNIRRLFTFVILFIFTILCVDINGINIYSAGNRLSVSTIIPDNQIDKRQTYFDLRMVPGEEQVIQIILKNSAKTDIKARVKINSASTGRNGTITYNLEDIKDESMNISITDIAYLESELVHVPARGNTVVNINLKMPNEEFDGVILGGIVVTEEETEVADSNISNNSNISLKNRFTCITGLKLSENDNKVTPDFELKGIAATLVNYKTSVTVGLRNKMPLIIKEMEVIANIYKSNSETVLYNLSLDNAEMAPYSTGDFVIDWNSLELKAGEYRLEMTVNYNDNTWKWNEDFTINDVAKLNEQGIGLVKDNLLHNILYYVLVTIFLLIVVGFLMYNLGRRRANDR